MYELIIVIVTIGILAAVALPRLKTNTLQEETLKVVDYIRYTQHLAMVDDKYDPKSANWQQNAWCVQINENNLSIFSGSTYAKDPLDQSNIQEKKFKITLSPTKTICFDELGRPYDSSFSYSNLLHNELNITASFEGEELNISIHPETGFVSFQ
ncbi:hypothetical protein NitYY0814_C1419 [Nitratiruptor sp. YY08-14]|nr:hypothetical protein NitYY0810_C1412 [Nitratiruptor sp. YY08-10]BCD64568.1 hypothetical protein NitYY0814_C1419 [Nitratiruptor sp. YY08-14]